MPNEKKNNNKQLLIILIVTFNLCAMVVIVLSLENICALFSQISIFEPFFLLLVSVILGIIFLIKFSKEE
jgi:hypothetical protein